MPVLDELEEYSMVVEDLSTSTELLLDLEPEIETELELLEEPDAEIEAELDEAELEDPLTWAMARTRFITSGLFKMLCVDANSFSSWAILVRSA